MIMATAARKITDASARAKSAHDEAFKAIETAIKTAAQNGLSEATVAVPSNIPNLCEQVEDHGYNLTSPKVDGRDRILHLSW